MQCKNRIHRSIVGCIAFYWHLLFLTSIHLTIKFHINKCVADTKCFHCAISQASLLSRMYHNETMGSVSLTRAQPLLEPARLCPVFFSAGNLGVRCSENVGQLLYVHGERNLLQEQARALRPDWWHDRPIMEVDMRGAEKRMSYEKGVLVFLGFFYEMSD